MQNEAKAVLFTGRGSENILLRDLFDPDIHLTPEEQNGKIIPNVGTIVVDSTNYQLFIVSAVDSITHKSTLEPIRIVVEEKDKVEVYSYTNDKFMLYFDDRVKPTNLVVDSKLVLFGESLTEYKLFKTDENGERISIGAYIGTNGEILSDRIPFCKYKHGDTDAKQCTDCHTLFTLKEGDIVELECYDSKGRLSCVINLFTKRATTLNDLGTPLDPIVAMEADCLQKLNDNEWYIYERQDSSHLGMMVTVYYASGKEERRNIDNMQVCLYGLDGFVPSYPGHKRKLLFKYYLANNEPSTINSVENGHRFICIEKTLTVVKNVTDYSLKVSVIPIYDASKNLWNLKFFGYTDRGDRVLDLTSQVTINSEHPFDSRLFNEFQMVEFSLDISSIFNIATETIYKQTVWVKVRDFGLYEKYVLKESPHSDFVYGSENHDSRRPVVHYDPDKEMYFIPDSVFINTASFLRSFYRLSTPPFNRKISVEPKEPTHFTIRSPVSGSTILPSPIEVSKYDKAFNLIETAGDGQFVDTELIVEFLEKQGENFFTIYGVPVSCIETGLRFND